MQPNKFKIQQRTAILESSSGGHVRNRGNATAGAAAGREGSSGNWLPERFLLGLLPFVCRIERYARRSARTARVIGYPPPGASGTLIFEQQESRATHLVLR
jgi:hypothetical protein